MRFSDKRLEAVWGIEIFLAAFFFALSIYAALVIPDGSLEETWQGTLMMTIIMCICGLGSWFILIEPIGNIRIVTRTGIYKRSPWTGEAFIEWGSIKSVKWNSFISNFVVRSDDGFFAVSPIVVNLERFAEGIISHVDKDRWEKAERKLRKALRGPFQP